MPDRVISVPQVAQIATKIKNKFDNVNGRLDGYIDGVNQTFTHTGATAWDFFPCLLLNGIGYKVANHNAEHVMAVKIRKQDGTEVAVGTAPASGNLDFVVSDDGYSEVGGYMYDGASFTVTNGYSSHEAIMAKASEYDLQLSDRGVQTFKKYGDFQHYGLKNDGTYQTGQKYRVSSTDVMNFDRDITVSVKDGFRWGYFPFNGEAIEPWSGWFTASVTVKANTDFLVQIARVTEVTSEVAEVDEFVRAVTFETEVGAKVDTIPQILDSIGLNPLTTTWVQGGIGSNGLDQTDNRRIRTGYIDMGEALKATIYNGYYAAFVQYDDKYVMLENTGWKTGNVTLPKFNADAKFIRVTLAKTVSGTTTIDVSEKTNIELTMINKDVAGRLVTIENKLKGGAYQYSGEEIPSKVNSFSARKIFRFTYDGIVETPQDADIYGSYFVSAFAKNDNQSIKIYSLDDYTLLGTISVNVQHGSGIQFSGEFYDESDIMPLLYAGGWTSNEINIIRITYINNEWSATIVRRLKIPTEQGYYLAPSIDTQKNILYCYGYKNMSLHADNDNKMVLVKCDLSNLTDNGDGTFSPAILNRLETPYIGVMQGRKYFKNRLYMGFANTSAPFNARFLSIDVNTGEVMTDIDMSEIATVESEGLCYKIIGNNILWFYTDYYNVYELEF